MALSVYTFKSYLKEPYDKPNYCLYDNIICSLDSSPETGWILISDIFY